MTGHIKEKGGGGGEAVGESRAHLAAGLGTDDERCGQKKPVLTIKNPKDDQRGGQARIEGLGSGTLDSVRLQALKLLLLLLAL